jgi:formyltetrahydrofolate synthetase
VDFKLDTTEKIITGGEILDFMHEETPEFPVIILTNVPDESKTSGLTDPDKVYAKKTFLDPRSPETKEKVRNMQLNMEKYINHRQKLEARLVVALNKYQNDIDADNVM